ncbi:MAG: PepSY1/2 domain-containing protein [Christensenellales bacterium]
MKKIYKIFAVSIAGALIVALSVYSIILDDQKKVLSNQIAATYQKSFEELVVDLDSLETKLCKLEAASGLNQYSMLLMDVWRQTGDTESSIAALPVAYDGTSSLTQFINRMGDYCRYLSKKIAQNQDISEEDMGQIRLLAGSCRQISQQLTTMQQQGYPTEAIALGGAFLPEERLEGNLDFSNQEFPRLIYDGPFSESTENKQPEGLSGQQMTQDQAKSIAAAFLDVDVNTLSSDGEINANITCFAFSGEQDRKPFSIYIAKQGGNVLWYMSQRETGISAVPTDERYEQLTAIAQQYLINKGYGETAASYAQFYGGMAIINLAPVENGVVLYPDLIKVWVDISANDVAGIDAYNYLMSHKQRRLNPPVLTELQAREKINGSLTITNVRLALIPLETNEEKLCYEFTGSINDHDYIIYVNAETGMEEDILIIQHTNEGTLVM